MIHMINPFLSKKFIVFTIAVIIQIIVFVLIELDPSLKIQSQIFAQRIHELSIVVILAFMVQDSIFALSNRSIVTRNQNI
jgi:hypothetical protein